MNGNGHTSISDLFPDDGLRIRLNTGYEVEVCAESYEEDLDHLFQALLGEHALQTAKDSGDWNRAIDELFAGIHYVVSDADDKVARILLQAALQKACIDVMRKLLDDK